MVKVCCFISMLIVEDLEYQFLDKTIFYRVVVLVGRVFKNSPS